MEKTQFVSLCLFDPQLTSVVSHLNASSNSVFGGVVEIKFRSICSTSHTVAYCSVKTTQAFCLLCVWTFDFVISPKKTESPNQTLALGGTSVYYCVNGALCDAFGGRLIEPFFIYYGIMGINSCWRASLSWGKPKARLGKPLLFTKCKTCN